MTPPTQKSRQEGILACQARIEALEREAREEARRESWALVRRSDQHRGLLGVGSKSKLGTSKERRIDRLAFEHYLALARAKRAEEIKSLRREIAELGGKSKPRHLQEPLVLQG